ncbi:TPA: LysM domain-containing protein, partial [Candidatus Bipolaricaulota bacterium]|nr:LysM domain-containing protein [Candidatus Bipolaricaulota bacterium]
MKGVLLKILIAVLALSPLILVTGVAVGAPEASGEIIHIVKAGETLFALGRLYGVSPWAIARVNHLPNPDLIYVGQRLIIPVPQPPPPPPPP